MSISRPTYVTREEVKASLDVAETARADDRIDRAIEAASADVDGFLRRTFSPMLATRYFPWPDVAYRSPYRLWLDDAEVITVTSLVSGGVTIAPADYFLEPANSGPPYWAIETDLSSSASFQAGDTRQRAIAVTGLFGYQNDEESVGALSGSLSDSATSASVTWTTPKVGVGSLLRIDSEYMVVTGRSMVTTGQTLQANLLKDVAGTTVAVTTGSAFQEGSVILIDAERMKVVDIAGNNLVVKRAHDGSVLAAHSSGATIYALTGVTLRRGAQGSTAAAHSSSAAVSRHQPPGLVRDLALAYALTQHLQEAAGYARVVGAGENQQEVAGRGLKTIEAAAFVRHGHQILIGAV